MWQSILENIVANKVLVSVVVAGVLCQLLKILIFIFVHKQRLHVKDIVVTGGMPSTHSALVWAMAVSIFLSEGISTAFVLSVVLLVIVLRDAMGVRRTAGEEGHIIHQIIKKTNLKIKEYHYAMGHTPKQVVVGSVIGIAVSFIVYGLL